MYKFSTIFNVKMLFVCETEEGKSKSFFQLKSCNELKKKLNLLQLKEKRLETPPLK